MGLGAASGSNIAQSHASGQAETTVNAGTSGISAGSFNIFAANSDDILAKADGSNAGIMDISPYAGRVENTVTARPLLILVVLLTLWKASKPRRCVRI